MCIDVARYAWPYFLKLHIRYAWPYFLKLHIKIESPSRDIILLNATTYRNRNVKTEED